MSQIPQEIYITVALKRLSGGDTMQRSPIKFISSALAVLFLALIFSGCKKQPPLPVAVSSTVSDTSSAVSALPSEPPVSSEQSVAPASSKTVSTASAVTSDTAFKPLSSDTAWYYSHLSERCKYAYTKLFAAALSRADEPIALFGCTFDEIAVADYAVRSDHPELFLTPSSYITELEGETYSVRYHDTESGIDWFLKGDTAKKAENELAKKVNGFLASLPKDASDSAIALAAHDLLCGTVYDDDAAGDPASYPFAFTAYGALVNGKAVCEGYAKAFQLLMNAAGVECICVSGELLTEPHMWNEVKLGGEWYHIDCTADAAADRCHLYFGCTDKFILDSGRFPDGDFSEATDGSFNLMRPVCTATAENFFRRRGYILESEIPGDGLVALLVSGTKRIEIYLDEAIGADTFDYHAFLTSEKLSGFDGITLKFTSLSKRYFVLERE